MDWILYDNGLRHERVKRIKGTAIATFVCFCNFYIQRIYFGFRALTIWYFSFVNHQTELDALMRNIPEMPRQTFEI